MNTSTKNNESSTSRVKIHALWSRLVASSVDKFTIEKYKIDGQLLMELAGKAVADQLMTDMDFSRPGKSPSVLVLAGSGNNGGDALVAARWLIHYGVECRIFFVKDKSSSPSPDCQRQLERLEKQNISVLPYKEGDLESLEMSPDYVLDGLFGIGFHGKLSSLHENCLKSAAKLKSKVYAIDIPSGMNCNIGYEANLPLCANRTITFGSYKISQILMPSAGACGDTIVKDIGFAKFAEQEASASEESNFGIIDIKEVIKKNYWNELKPDSHKFDRGHILILGGSAGKFGAPLLAGLAALRSGAGWVSLALPQDLSLIAKELYPLPPEMTFEDFYRPEVLDGKALLSFLVQRKVKCVVIGPGIVDFSWKKQSSLISALSEYISQHNGRLLIDAGALKDIDDLALWSDEKSVLYTPHPGEWTRLTKTPLNPPLDQEALAFANKWRQKKSCTLVYKAARPIVLGSSNLLDTCGFNETALVLPWGTNALARAGSGDVYAGIAAAHLAIGYDACFSAIRSYAVLSNAAKILEEKNPHGILATDLVNNIAIAQHIAS